MIQTGFYYDSEEENYDEEEYYEEEPMQEAKNKLTDAEKQMNSAITASTAVDEDEEEEYVHDMFDFSVNQLSVKNKKNKIVNDQAEGEAEEETEEETAEKKYARFRGADKIFHRILWDEKFDRDEFVIGYEDRFEGIIEEPFKVFEMLKEDIPFHRIRYFKKMGEIVWERKTKTNKL
jgi:uncharacterized protein (UPF0248 family)